MSLRLFNTLTRQIEEFRPLTAGRVSMYTCGPTIWNYAHIGNFRTFLFEDLLRRWLEASGFEVFHMMNLTDVDDRIIKEAGKQQIPIGGFTDPFATAFFEDRDFLRIRPAHAYPRATGMRFIEAMIQMVERLLANGSAYKGEDGSVYFAIAKFPAYGRLSQLDRRELKSGASGRVSSDEYAKEDARDFALWKAADAQDEAVGAAWDAPFGRGRPGWHLECSAMALALLKEKWGGEVLDIHAGGVDLIFPHHEDEIAQSCAYTGQPDFARYWLHGEFLNVRGTKMSKRFGNITTPRDLKADGVDPGTVRLLMFQTHYRQKLDLTDESLQAADRAAQRLAEFARRFEDPALSLGALPEQAGAGPATTALEQAAGTLRRVVRDGLDDDLNAPRAVAALFDFVAAGNKALDEQARVSAAARAEFDRVARQILDVIPAAGQRLRLETDGVALEEGAEAAVSLTDAPPSEPAAEEGWAVAWARARADAKRRKDYKEADRIRGLLKGRGWEIRDNKDGSVEVRRG